MRHWRIQLLWALFLVRGAFYCSMFPLWEGWDEYAHFGWVQHWLAEGTLPSLDDSFSREIDESMRLTPLADELRWLGPPYLTHSEWWTLPVAERESLVRALAALPPRLAGEASVTARQFYEAQQPPLYYWLLSAPMRLAEDWPLARRVLLARLFDVAVASVAIPLAWATARTLVGESVALLCAALIAVAPGFAIDASRVANDCLAIALFSLLLLVLARPRPHWAAAGALLGACLLTKAYLLALVPALAVWWAMRRDWRMLARSLTVALALAGWWYARNLAMGHSLSGWLDHAAPAALAAAAFHVNWLSAAHVIAKSFTWFGGWSFLTLKSWMYALVEAIYVAAFALAIARNGRKLALLFLLTGAYGAAMAYGVLVGYAAHGVSNLPGWYLWPLAPVFALIAVAGFGRYAAALVCLFAALDLWGAAAMLAPYYAGLVERNRAAGGQFFAALARLHVPAGLGIAWIAATLAIPVMCLLNRRFDSTGAD